MRHHGASFTTPSLQVAMNELSNHDHSRFLTRTNHKVGRTNTLGPEAANQGVNKAVLREAVVIQMTWPGAPTIYYGDEAGVCGFTDPDNRRTYPWGHEDKELINFHKDIIRIHKQHKEFLTGSLKYMESEYNVIGYGRFNRQQQSVILINNNDYEITKELMVWYLGIPKEATMKQLLLTTADGYTTEMTEYPVIGGKVSVKLPATSAIILHYEDEECVAKNFLQFME
jgi:alpha-glucosidase